MEIFPDNQIKKIPGTISPQCSNLTEIGCCLPRRERPFVCIWYFCPDQTRTAQYQNGSFAEKIIEIKKLRNQMEEIFCLVSSS
ncbi:MAG: hypothetical protein PF503_02925, partial [Desulfobacula sp.]|jgi:hypothetical protein|nr:hypothetical protein [Desulfobacula sp.]